YSNRWLIKLEPGIYNVGTTPVVLQDYVDIEGSGLIESHIQGAFDPTPLLLGGLVRGANNSELRNLTISCVSNATTTSCQALSLDHASPRLSQMRILVQGTGTANHWGIRMLDSAPVLDDVDIQVTTTGAHNYGIVYTGQSAVNVLRSKIVARNASVENLAIVLRDAHTLSSMRDSTLTANGGGNAFGIAYISSSTTDSLVLDNVLISAQGASLKGAGIGLYSGSLGSPTVLVEGGRIVGSTDGVDFSAFTGTGTVELRHTEIEAPQYLAQAANVRLYLSRTKGTGIVSSIISQQCAAVVNNAGTFLTSTCP